MNEYDMQLYRDLVSSIIESSILDVDPRMLAKVEQELQKQGLGMNDSLEAPKELLSALQKICGIKHPMILKSIDEKMSRVGNPKFDNMLSVLNDKSIKQN